MKRSVRERLERLIDKKTDKLQDFTRSEIIDGCRVWIGSTPQFGRFGPHGTGQMEAPKFWAGRVARLDKLRLILDPTTRQRWVAAPD